MDELDPHVLWVPEGQDYGGITDRHLVAPSELILGALDILEPVFDHPERYFKRRFNVNPEQFIMLRWMAQNLFPHHVRRFPRVMYLCKVATDQTRWNRRHNRHGLSEEDCTIKYKPEYDQAKCVCDPNTLVVDEGLTQEINGTLVLKTTIVDNNNNTNSTQQQQRQEQQTPPQLVFTNATKYLGVFRRGSPARVNLLLFSM
eukprot:CAMPEP_0116548130 /NCGR_PEP_ID=MMETSP0397-20121206/4154_1 /TAXON_ID=216820 /ORGANISM="Cyclophora tenuis, Strain ECT3854" /LENGTH=200 /DNA_ID=CAMNT_0004072723 /DNA_START=36 /DNA_END=639 /DNA_ORIENTATION=+